MYYELHEPSAQREKGYIGMLCTLHQPTGSAAFVHINVPVAVHGPHLPVLSTPSLRCFHLLYEVTSGFNASEFFPRCTPSVPAMK